MLDSAHYDVLIIGGGVIGTATAMALTAQHNLKVAVLEAETRLAAHQSSHNSGVIHAGLYYKPGSLKALNCTRGREWLIHFCEANNIPHARCGKLVVATTAGELPALDELERRGRANGLEGLRRLGPEEIREHEPHAAGIAGLFVPQTGVVRFERVVEAYAALARHAGGVIHTGARVVGCQRRADGLLLKTSRGAIAGRSLINCAGLQCDRVARLCGVDPGLSIIPFRGEYYHLAPAAHGLVRSLIYPVPDPRFPFLGVHFTRTVDGQVEAGPNAVLALRREGYTRRDISCNDTTEMLGYGGFWRMSAKYWRTGLGEMVRSFSKERFVKALSRLVPEIRPEHCAPGGSGVRAQAVTPDGRLVDDFRIVEAERMIHVLNAPSPAATSSLSIARTLSEMAVRRLGFPGGS